jgi:glycine hydroxymethyltransferase
MTISSDLPPREAVAALLQSEAAHARYRLQGCINLVASQNRLSAPVLRLLGSSFAGKFASGELGARAHAGAKWIDAMEALVGSLAGRLFAPFPVEIRPMSGSMANETVLCAAVRPGDTIVAPAGIAGGHRSLRPDGFAGFMGLEVVDLPFGADGLEVDLDALEALVARVRPRLVVIGTAKILFPYPVAAIAAIAAAHGAEVFYDGAHVAGLIAGGRFQDPLAEGAAYLTGSTQKTFPGPVGGLVVSRDGDRHARIRHTARARFDNYQNNRIAAMGVVFAEMLAFGPRLSGAVIDAARALAEALAREGLDLVGARLGYTRSHMLMLDVSRLGPAAALVRRLEEARILATMTDLRTEAGGVGQGIRMGANDIGRLGFDRDDVAELAGLIADILLGRRSPERVRPAVEALADRRRTLLHAFDEPHDAAVPAPPAS